MIDPAAQAAIEKLGGRVSGLEAQLHELGELLAAVAPRRAEPADPQLALAHTEDRIALAEARVERPAHLVAGRRYRLGPRCTMAERIVALHRVDRDGSCYCTYEDNGASCFPRWDSLEPLDDASGVASVAASLPPAGDPSSAGGVCLGSWVFAAADVGGTEYGQVVAVDADRVTVRTARHGTVVVPNRPGRVYVAPEGFGA